jgi:chemotaxis regulatin CheY-phosphate phosphatase CheZ
MTNILIDPLLILLRRHEAANAAYDALDFDASEAERSHLYAACSRTMDAINDRKPAATTAEGAAAALEHVLNDETLNEDMVGMFLRHLIAAARDYIVRTAGSKLDPT